MIDCVIHTKDALVITRLPHLSSYHQSGAHGRMKLLKRRISKLLEEYNIKQNNIFDELNHSYQYISFKNLTKKKMTFFIAVHLTFFLFIKML